MRNFKRTVVSQYQNSDTLLSLLDSINQWVDPAADFDAWHDAVWNLDTATGPGLDVWGRIVGVGRVLAVPQETLSFGFQTGADPADTAPFGEAPFWTGVQATSAYVLPDEAYRALVLIKAAANIAACTAPAINALLRSLFAGRGRAYVTDGGDMSMGYVFEFYLRPYEVAIIEQSGALPRPSGVAVNFQQILSNATFGFAEAGTDFAPFDAGTFYPNNGLSIYT